MASPKGIRLLFAGASLLLLASCMDHPPTETAIPFSVPFNRDDIVSVCYDTGDHNRSEIEAVALESCGKQAISVTPWRVDTYLNDCPILKKTRASFVCNLSGN